MTSFVVTNLTGVVNAVNAERQWRLRVSLAPTLAGVVVNAVNAERQWRRFSLKNGVFAFWRGERGERRKAMETRRHCRNAPLPARRGERGERRKAMETPDVRQTIQLSSKGGERGERRKAMETLQGGKGD